MATKFDQLQKDVAAGQEETAQLVAKKLKRAPDYQFRRKGNEKQFLFNESVSDSIQTAAGMLEKMKPAVPQEATLLKNAKEQLMEGAKAIEERQKLIRIADQSEYGWPVAEAYHQADELAAEEISSKRMEEAVKQVEQKYRRQKRRRDDYRAKEPAWREPQPPYVGPPPPTGQLAGPTPPMMYPLVPQPQPLSYNRPPGPRPRVPGPCFNCSQMGHLRSNCPNKISRPYPFRDVLLSGVNNMCYNITDSVYDRYPTTCMSWEGTNSVCHDESGIPIVSVNNVSHDQSLPHVSVDNIHLKDCFSVSSVKGATVSGNGSQHIDLPVVGPSTLVHAPNTLSQSKGNTQVQTTECGKSCEPTTRQTTGRNDTPPVNEDVHDPEDLEHHGYWEVEQTPDQIRDVQGWLKRIQVFGERSSRPHSQYLNGFPKDINSLFSPCPPHILVKTRSQHCRMLILFRPQFLTYWTTVAYK